MLTFSAGEQSNAIAENYRNHRNRDFVNQSSSKKLTDYFAAINVYPFSVGKSIRQFHRGTRIEPYCVVHRRWAVRHHDDSLAIVWPLLVLEDGVIRAPAYYDCIYGGHKVLVTMCFINRVNDR